MKTGEGAVDCAGGELGAMVIPGPCLCLLETVWVLGTSLAAINVLAND